MAYTLTGVSSSGEEEPKGLKELGSARNEKGGTEEARVTEEFRIAGPWLHLRMMHCSVVDFRHRRMEPR